VTRLNAYHCKLNIIQQGKAMTIQDQAKKPAMTASERQRQCRAKRKETGLREVRSAFAFPEDHAEIKSFAVDLTAKRRAAKTEGAAKKKAKKV